MQKTQEKNFVPVFRIKLIRILISAMMGANFFSEKVPDFIAFF
jgi:hypothetical protein